MGAAYIPGTFPTVGVASRMQLAQVRTSFAEVDRLYDAYVMALESGLAPMAKGAKGTVTGPLLTAMSAQTSLPKNTVAAWLNALVQEVEENGRGYYLDPVSADKAAVGKFDPVNHPIESIKTVASGVGQAAGGLLKPVADPVTNLVKYAAIALVAGASIYAIYTFTPLFKSGKRRKKG